MQRRPATTRHGPPAERAARRRHDEAAKLLFIGEVVADGIRVAVPELAATLRLDTIKPLPTEYVSQERTKRFGDAVFSVKFRKGRFPPTVSGRRARRRYLLVPTEFQHRDDASMAQRVREYTAEMEGHYRHQGLIRTGEHPPVLALVIHTGPGRWTAPDGTDALRRLPKRTVRHLAAYQPQAYIPLDVGRRSALDMSDASRLGAAAALVRCATARELAARLVEEWDRFGNPDDMRFRRGMLAWAEETVLGFPDSGFELPSFEELEGLKEKDMAYLLEDKVKQWQAGWLSEGREEGQRDLLEGLAERRFGADAAKRLSTALNGSPTSERVAELGDLIVRCETEDEFLAALRPQQGG